MKNKSARVLITLDCPRNCSYCCNGFESVMQEAVVKGDLDFVGNLDEILISGGEPLLYPDYLINLINKIRKINPKIKIYLYSALYTDRMEEIVNLIEGLHFTLHKNTNYEDILGFYKVQSLARMYPDKSFRAYINPDIKYNVRITPSRWKRLEIKDWLPEGECELPEDELIILKKLKFKGGNKNG